MKTIAQLKKIAQTHFNKYIRNRDKGLACISCGNILPPEKMQAGHLFSVKQTGHLRFNEYNTNGECCGCNGFNSNHQIYYSINLQKKIGTEAFQKLLSEAKNKPIEFTRIYLESIIKLY